MSISSGVSSKLCEEFLRVYPERHQHRYGALRHVITDVVGKFLECGDLEEMFRQRVIAFLLERRLLPPERAHMLLGPAHSGFGAHRSRRVDPEEFRRIRGRDSPPARRAVRRSGSPRRLRRW